jgi:hypothetical protein
MVTRQQYYAIKAGLQPAEKDLIKFYEVQWFMQQRIPTVQEVFEYLRKTRPRLKLTTVNYYLDRWPVKKALTDRGIPFLQHTQSELTEAQIAAATVMMNFADERPTSDKLEQLGVSSTQYYAWLNDPQFRNFVASLEEQNKINIRPSAVAEFTKKIHSGDWNAVKYYLEVTGAFKDESTQPQSAQMVKMIIEIIQKHVKDPDVMLAIANDIIGVSGDRTLEAVDPRKEITADYTVEDEELVKAQKMLGFG